MPNLGGAVVFEARGLEAVLQRLRHLGIFLDVTLGFVEHQKTGTARRQEVEILFLRDGQVPPCQGEGTHLIDGHVGGGAAAIPILKFFQLDIQRPKNRQQRFFIRLARSSQRTTRVIEVSFHAATSFLCASTASSIV